MWRRSRFTGRESLAFNLFFFSLVNLLSGLTVKCFTDIQNVPRIVSFGNNKDIFNLKLCRYVTSAASMAFSMKM